MWIAPLFGLALHRSCLHQEKGDQMLTPRLSVSAVGVGIVAALIAAAYTGRSQFIATAQESSRQASPQQEPPTPVVDTHHLMELFNRPLYEFLKKSVAQRPSGKEGWEEISNRGLQVAEVANLVALREREAARDQWVEMSGNLQRSGVRLSEAASSGNWAATRQAYQDVVNQCNSCHQAISPDKAPQLQP
jgi:hypothetical protein